jgi:hypothetical protein
MTNRRKKRFEGPYLLALLALVVLIWAGKPVRAQTAPTVPMTSGTSANQVPDADTKQWQIAEFDKFLDSHPELAQQLRKDPSLINNEEFVEHHEALKDYLQEHPGIREEIRENPNAFMRQEQRYDQREDERRGADNRGDRDNGRRQVAVFDRFLDSHPEVAEQLRKNPSLVNNKDFVEDHAALQQFLQENPGIREEIRENPQAFMQREERFDENEGRDRDRDATIDRDRMNGQTTMVGARGKGDNDTTTGQLASADRFFDAHPEIAEQLSKNPSLINNEEFVEQHPALQQYLQSHPEVREEMKENPNAFMHQEAGFDQHQATAGHDKDRDEMGGFGAFLGAHASVAQELSKNPSLANNKEYLESHPELREYLSAHPNLQARLAANPQTVMSTIDVNNRARTAAPKPDIKH